MSEANGFDLSGIIDDAKKVLLNPAGFYREMPKTGGFVNPVIFVVVMALAAGLITALVSFLGGGFLLGTRGGLMSIILVPVFAVIGSFIGAAIMFVIWRLLGSLESYETAYRCVAYASAVYPVSALASIFPYLGTVVSIAWGSWLMIVASIEVHGVAANKAKIVFAILAAIALFINLNAENRMRNMQGMLEQYGTKMQDLENMTPEEAGEVFGKFLQGMEKSRQEQQQ